MSIREVKFKARKALKGKWGLAILASFITGIIYFGVDSAFGILLNGGTDGWFGGQTNTLSNLSIVADIILIPLIIGYYWFCLKLVRGEDPEIGKLFDGYSNAGIFGKGIGIGVLMSVYSALWSLLLIIPGIVKSLAYSQSYFIFKDNPEMGLNEIITKSRKLMSGYKWKFFLLQLSFLGWALLSIITLGIGLLWLYPYITTSNAEFYNQLLDNEKSIDLTK